MDLQSVYLSALFILLFFFLMMLKFWKKPKKAASTPNMPPGPKKLPIVGNLHNLYGSKVPHIQLRDLATKYGSLMHLQLGEVSTIVISSPDYAKEVMKTHDINFASRPHSLATEILSYDSTDIGYAPYGDYWRQLRKICTLELLSAKRVQSFRPIREEEIGRMMKWIASQEGSVINLTQAVVSLILTIISRAAFGKKCKDQDEFMSALTESIGLAAGFNIGDLFPSVKFLQVISGLRPKLERLRRQIDRILENIINDHREAKLVAKERQDEAEEDLMDVLLKFEGSDDMDLQLNVDNIKAIALDILSAGSETSATAINWAFAEIIKDSRVMKKAQTEIRKVFDLKEKANETSIAELKYLKAVVKETLRLHPPAPLLLPRECGQACEISGYHISSKTKVLVNAWAIGRDPNYWTEPEKFYPERFMDSSIDYKGSNFEYIPFGAGRRMCPGIAFGMINVELPLALLLYHFDWKLPNGMKNEELDMAEEFGVSVKRKHDLYLVPIPRCPLPAA